MILKSFLKKWLFVILFFSIAMCLIYYFFIKNSDDTTKNRIAIVTEASAVPNPIKVKRVALVIGNTAYSDKRLPNAVNDADDMFAALERLGFDVELLKDADRTSMGRAVRRLGVKAQGAETALFYFAGHGSQEESRNYIWPLKAMPKHDVDLDEELYPIAKVLEAIERKSRNSIIILDACRNAPVTGKAVRSTMGSGFSKIKDKDEGTAIVYAAAPGETASDGQGRNGLFTSALLAALSGKDLSFNGVMQNTALEVQKQNKNQRPHVNADELLRSTFSFGGPVTVAPSPVMLESEYWSSIKDSKDAADFEAYLTDYPKGQFRRLAENRVKVLKVAVSEVSNSSAIQPSTSVISTLAPPPSTQIDQIVKDCEGCPEMVIVPAGSFVMGSPESEIGRLANESPQRTIALKSFAMSKTEVTQGQYKDIMGHNPSYFKDCGESCPVESVSWDDAQEFIKKLNIKSRKNYSLPSEAQWEYAARAGTKMPFYTGSFLHAEHSNFDANFTYNGSAKGLFKGGTVKVKTYKPNVFDLYEMHGNVMEWTEDIWHENYIGAPIDGSAWLTEGSKLQRVLRGGSWNNTPQNLRSAKRFKFPSTTKDSSIGFRLIRPI